MLQRAWMPDEKLHNRTTVLEMTFSLQNKSGVKFQLSETGAGAKEFVKGVYTEVGKVLEVTDRRGSLLLSCPGHSMHIDIEDCDTQLLK